VTDAADPAVSDMGSTRGAEALGSSETQFFTICTRSYLAFGLTLGASVRRHHPDAGFTIWLLDEGPVPAVPAGIATRPIADAFDADDLAHLTLYYDVLELATAVKPRCFMQHFAGGARQVLYLDPDILLFRPLDEVFALLGAGHTGVLTPHLLEPLPADRAKPDDLEILQSGIYNLGFLALSAGDASAALLRWWSNWLDTHCFVDKSTGTFTDQKWMNFAPLFWPSLGILRDTSYNVAYWNLPQRRLDGERGHWSVDGRPLAFFHFSGLDPERPGVLSKHQTRIDVVSGSPLATLLGHYAALLLAAGHRELKRLGWNRSVFANGMPLDTVARRAYREAVAQGRRFADPLGIGPGTFFDWLTAMVPGESARAQPAPITRYLLTLYEMRPDVRQAFPDLFGRDREAFLHWAGTSGLREMAISPELLDYQLSGRPLGINYAGYLRAELGLGEAARGYIRALQGQGVALSYLDTSDLCSSRLGDESLDLAPGGDDGHPHPINIVHVNADQLLHFRDQVGPDFFAGRYTIGIWAWETPDFPQQWYDRFDLLDEIWVGGSFMGHAIAKASPVPVLVMPHVIEVPEVEPQRAEFGLADDEYLYLFYFDFHSTPARKNPYGAIEAFRRAFGPDEPARLIIKSMNGHNRPDELRRMKEAAAGLRVSFIDETMDGLKRFELLAACDAFVSLHRAEGFGLGLAEAMAMGKPVIATGWSGNMDFMTVANSFPVRYSLEPLEETDPPYEAGSLWALPDLDDAARQMRLVFEDRALAAAVGARARSDLRREYHAAVIGPQLCARLKLIAERQSFADRPAPATLTFSSLLRLRPRLLSLLRRGWQMTLRLVPSRHHARLRRLTETLRRRVASGY